VNTTAASLAPGEPLRARAQRLLRERLGVGAVLVILIVVLAIFAPNFTEPQNISNVLRQVSLNAVLATGMTFVILTAGIDLSVGSMVALCGVLAVFLFDQGVPAPLCVLGAVACGAACGAVNGVLIARAGLAAFIVTLGALTYLRGLAFVTTDAKPLIAPELGYAYLGAGSIGSIPVPAIIMAVVAIVGHVVLSRTVFGRHVYAVGDNPQAAELSGINVKSVLTRVYVIMGLCAGIGGIIFSARLYSGQPEGAAGYELDAIAAVVLGGTSLFGGVGRITGTIIGAFIIGVLNNGMVLLDIPFYYQLIVKGVVVIGAVLLDRLRIARAAT
jgi:ribose transport system permease protein